MNSNITELFINKFYNIFIQRSLIVNANNGYAFIGCIIFKRLNNCYTIGYNQYNIGKFNGVYYDNIHAEIDAMNKLKPNYSKKHKRINLFVFRINNLLHLMNAKCCINCINNIYRIAKIKGYIIKNIYYSDDNQNIIIY